MVKKNAEKDVGFVRQFNELKKKHPDAVLLFRKGDPVMNWTNICPS